MKGPIPEAALAQHIIALGKTRSGKSSKLRVLVEQLLVEHKPVSIIDPKGDWWGLKSSADGKSAGFPLVIFGGEHADVPINSHSGAHIAEIVATGNRPALIDLGGWMVAERTRFFIDFSSTFFKLSKGTRHLVIDEVHNFAPKGRIFDPDAGKALHWANRLASEGQGKGIILLAASQRPQKVHNDFLTSCETLIAAKVIHKSDRDAIKDWIDGCADGAKGKEVIAGLAQLKKPSAWVWSPETDFGPQLVTFPMFRTYDSFKPQAADAGKLKGWAEVDLEEVRTKLQDVVKEAEASDPKRLRARIAELERQAKNGGASAVNREDLKAAEHRAYERGRQDGELDAHRAAAAHLKSVKATLHQAVEGALSATPARLPSHTTPAPSVRSATPPRREPAPAKRQPHSNGHADPQSDLSPVQQRILNALAAAEQLSAEPPDRSLVALLSGYTHIQSTGFVKALSALSSASMVTYPPGGRVALTNAGRELAVVPGEPTTANELQERVIQLIGGAASKVLRPLIDAHREPMSRQDLASASGYGHIQSTGFVKTLGRLRTLGFIDYPSSGMVVAQPVLFLEH